MATVFANVRSYASVFALVLSHPGFEAFLLCCSFGISRYAFVSFSVLISTGLNFRLEMPLADAQAFLVDKARHVSQFHVLTVYF